MDIVTDDLKRKLANANGKVKEIERERAERRKVRMRTKMVPGDSSVPSSASASTDPSGSAVGNMASEDVAMADASDESKGKEKAREPVAGELEDEAVLRERESKAFEASIDPELKADTGASVTGLFELCGMCRMIHLISGRIADWLISNCYAQGCVCGLGTLYRICQEGCVPFSKVISRGGK